MGLSKIRKQFFFILTFLGGILSLRQVYFFEISIKFFIFWYTIWPFQENIVHLSEEPILNLSTQKPKKDRNTTK